MGNIDRNIIKKAHILGAKPKDVLRHIYIPNIIKSVVDSLRVGLGFAFVGAIVGEFMGSKRGIGYAIENAKGNFDIEAVLSIITVMMIIIGLLYIPVMIIEKGFSKWTMKGDLS